MMPKMHTSHGVCVGCAMCVCLYIVQVYVREHDV